MLTAIEAMQIAIAEARKGLGAVHPNPPVGCVIVSKSGELLSRGYHQKFGGPHAEIVALQQISDRDQLVDATIYVTLEPCAHEGKTPSCAKHLATLPIRKVVFGLQDPFPLVSGRGAEILRAAGIEVEEFSGLRDELEDLAEVFLWNQRQRKPFVAVKVATSLDGQMAHVSGDSKWITGEKSREYVHELRALYDAVLIGRETFLRDNPQLNIRHGAHAGKRNKVIVLDSDGKGLKRLPDSALFRCHDRKEIFWLVDENAKIPDSYGVEIVPIRKSFTTGVDLDHALSWLYEHDITSIFVEGGARVISSFLTANRVNRFYQFIAPHIMGAKTGLNFSHDVSIAKVRDRLELRNPKHLIFDPDVMVTGRLDQAAATDKP